MMDIYQDQDINGKALGKTLRIEYPAETEWHRRDKAVAKIRSFFAKLELENPEITSVSWRME